MCEGEEDKVLRRGMVMKNGQMEKKKSRSQYINDRADQVNGLTQEQALQTMYISLMYY